MANRSIPELITEFVQMVVRFAREQATKVFQESVVDPAKRVGAWIALGIVAASLVAIGVIFLAVGLFQLFAAMVGSTWLAYLIIAASYFIIAAVLIAVRARLSK